MTTIRETIENQLKRDFAKAPKAIFNQNDLRLEFSEKEKIYIGKDEICECGFSKLLHDEKGNCPKAERKFVKAKEIEWIEALQHTAVPFFASYCTVNVRKGNIESACAGTNYVSILQDGQEITCRLCNKKYTVNLVVPESSRAYQTLQDLRAESEE